MIRSIGPVKKEFRTLGLDTCNPTLIVGAILRGGLYLDGVVSFPSNRNSPSIEAAEKIIHSAYFPELRAIMLHNPNDQLDPTFIERRTNLPTIAISKDKPRRGKGYTPFQSNHCRLWVKTRLEPSALNRILSVSWTIHNLPEPVRVSHLLAKLRILPQSRCFMR
jgi:endonuclease V-like protein UPF0215 family